MDLKKIIKESLNKLIESDDKDWEWLNDIDPNVALINFFQKGKCYYIGKLLNNDGMSCLNFKEHTPSYKAHSYEDGRGALRFGDNYYLTPLFIEAKLKEKNLTLFDLESEENTNIMEADDFDWIKRIETPSKEFFKGKALEFQPPINNQKDMDVILDFLVSLGFNNNKTLRNYDFDYQWGDDDVVGLYLNERDKIIFTSVYWGDEPTYQDHIEGYAGTAVTVLDGWGYINNMDYYGY